MLLEVIATIVSNGGSSSRPLPSVIREQLLMDEDLETIRTLHHTIQRKARQRLMIGRNSRSRNRNSRVNDNENENENEISGSRRDDVIIPVQVPDDTVVLQQDVTARLSVNGTALRADDDAPISSLLRHITTTTTTTTTTSNNNNDRGVPHVRFGSVSVPCERINDTTLCCLSPPHPPGIVKVSLVRCSNISHNNNNNYNNNHNNQNNNSNLTGNTNRRILLEEDDDEDEQDETTFEYVRLGAAFDAIFATTNSYCPLRSSQNKQDPTNNNGVIDNTNDDDDDDNGVLDDI